MASNWGGSLGAKLIKLISTTVGLSGPGAVPTWLARMHSRGDAALLWGGDVGERPSPIPSAAAWSWT